MALPPRAAVAAPHPVGVAGSRSSPLAGALGAFVHGFDLDARTRELLWQPLYLTLGSALAFFSAGAIGDWRGDAPGAARATRSCSRWRWGSTS